VLWRPSWEKQQLEESCWHSGFPECQCLLSMSIMLEVQHLHVKFMHIENLWLSTGRSGRSSFEFVGLPRRFPFRLFVGGMSVVVGWPTSKIFDGIEHRIFRDCTEYVVFLKVATHRTCTTVQSANGVDAITTDKQVASRTTRKMHQPEYK